MPPAALALLIGAGILHASWNLILKRTSERLLVTAWGLLVGALVFSPALVRAWPPPPGVWPFAALSAATLLGYYCALSRAYRDGDFSLVYPVARGAAPAMLALWGVLFFGERPSPVGMLGMALVLGGLVALGGAPLLSGRSAGESIRSALRGHGRAAAFAFLVALLVSIYSALDAAAVRRWEPIPYLVLVFALSGSALVPLLAIGRGRDAVRVLGSHLAPTATIAILTLAAYSLVLRAFQLAPVGYAGAVREVGIVLGALAGWLLLGERLGGVRTLGAALVFGGILVLAAAA